MENPKISWRAPNKNADSLMKIGLIGYIEGDTLILVSPNFVIFYLQLIFLYSENFIFLAWVVQKFEFWRPRLRGPPFWYPQILSFVSYLL